MLEMGIDEGCGVFRELVKATTGVAISLVKQALTLEVR